MKILLIVMGILLGLSLTANIFQYKAKTSWENLAHSSETQLQNANTNLGMANGRLYIAEGTIVSVQGKLLHNQIDDGLNQLLGYKYQGQVK